MLRQDTITREKNHMRSLIAGLLVAVIGIILQIISIYQSGIHNKNRQKKKTSMLASKRRLSLLK